ncbi:MAG: HAD family hydrolase, partial [Clostridiales bacterium]|nr:HAD family hydrolase [Clostridiales bacterium]
MTILMTVPTLKKMEPVKMKTLYLSDLDGTLIRSDERISAYTAETINRFVRGGGCFSYATARSIVTASKVTAGLNAEFPVICYNGAFIFKNGTNEILLSNFFSKKEIEFATEIFISQNFHPIVYAFKDGQECFSYIERCVTPAMRHFLDCRIGDPRRREVDNIDELYNGDVFYFACMDTEITLSPINEIFK